MSMYDVTYWSASKRREYTIEELNDSHLLNAEKRYAKERGHQWGRELDEKYGDETVYACTLCGTNQVSSESAECSHAQRLVDALRSEVVRRGLHLPKPDPGPREQQVNYGDVPDLIE